MIILELALVYAILATVFFVVTWPLRYVVKHRLHTWPALFAHIRARRALPRARARYRDH